MLLKQYIDDSHTAKVFSGFLGNINERDFVTPFSVKRCDLPSQKQEEFWMVVADASDPSRIRR